MTLSIRLQCADAHGSVIRAETRSGSVALAYTTYGHDPRALPACPSLRFTGELREWLSGNYLLGNGYRAYSPVLLRFTSPDDLSPFGEGGLNTYAYCAGDPINSVDPSGHTRQRMRTAPAPAASKWQLVKKSVRKKLAFVEDATTFARLFVRLLRNPTWSNRWAVAKQTGKMAIKYGPLAPVYWVYDWLRPTPAVPDQVVAASSQRSATEAPAPGRRTDVRQAADKRNELRSDTA